VSTQEESQAIPTTEARPESGTPSTGRLVIRVKISHDEPPPAPAEPRLSKGALLLILAAVAVLLTWAGISMFRSDPVPVATEEAPAPVVIDAPIPKRATDNAEAKAVEPEVRKQPAEPPSPINEVIPDVPRSALDTIRGTIRVSIRVNIDKRGTVVASTAEDRGPSRYFQRLATEASKKWTFTPATSEEQRTALVIFNFTRAGATARANPPQ
jgi:TonB family protein